MVFAILLLLKKWWNSCENARNGCNAYLLEQRQHEELTKAEIEAKKSPSRTERVSRCIKPRNRRSCRKESRLKSLIKVCEMKN